ncbi:hypothetical protein Bca52824_030067 [Brassica carinata]|uniref:Uncharacterized protein n=1 Tax=Brassica carinata TaxID=52824 RepID=A0A8X7V6D7_BRACI|nr:hypothetical protein Bca52824_030067 [Brassica carinata]
MLTINIIDPLFVVKEAMVSSGSVIVQYQFRGSSLHSKKIQLCRGNKRLEIMLGSAHGSGLFA